MKRKKGVQICVTVDDWMDEVIESIATKEGLSKSQIMKVLIKAQLESMGHSEASSIVSRHTIKPNEGQELLG